MDYFSSIDIASIGFVALATFGTVSAVNFFAKRLDSRQNFLLSVLFAVIYSFVPADLGNIAVNKFRDAFAIAVTLNGAYQFLGGVAKKVGESA